MKKTMRVLVSILVVACTLLFMFTGCSNDGKENTPGSTDASKTSNATSAASSESYLNEESELPIVKSPITLKVVTIKIPGGGATENLWFWKWAEKNTNIKFDVTQVESSAWNERKNIMFAAQELPDFFLNPDFTADEILRFGQIEKQLMPMNNLIEKYAPNIKKAFEKDPETKALVTCPDGNIYNLPTMGIEVYNTARAFINGVWLQNLSLEAPETLDDLYNVLLAFKEKDPNKNGQADEIPFSGSWKEGYPERIVVLSALGFNSYERMDLSVKDNKVVLPEADPLFGEYLKFMNKLFSEGLLDKDIFTQTQVQARAKTAQNIVGLSLEGSTQLISNDKWKDYAGFKPVTSQWNSGKIWPGAVTADLSRFMIASSSKYPEAAIRFADMYFNDKNNILLWYGPQKDSEDALGFEGWYVENNVIQYKLPPEVKSGWDYRIGYINPINGYKLGYNVLLNDFERLYGVKVGFDEANTYFRKEMDEKVIPYSKSIFPKVYLQPDQLEKRNTLFTTMKDYCEMMEAKFITGAEPLSNLDKYFSQLKKMGAEEYVKIYQQAYDAYLSNLKK